MSDSDLSDLEEQDAVSVSGSDQEQEAVEEQNEVSIEAEESDVKWADLVSIIFSATWFFTNSTFMFIFY